MVSVICKNCKTNFYAKPSWLKKGYGKYCSRSCGYAGKRNGETLRCDDCGIDTYKSQKALKGSQSGKFFCSKSCQTKWRNTTFMGNKHANWKGGNYSYRELLQRGNAPDVCTLCQIDDKRVLAAHHIDEDRTNNAIENLAWLCHNCHHLVHNYPKVAEQFMAVIV